MSTQNFSSTLAHYRTKAGMSQSKLAKETDIVPSYISRMENGTRMPTREVVERLSYSLNLDATERSRLMFSAGFALPGSPPVTRQILLDIDTLLDHPSQSEYARKIVLDQLNSISWWLRLAAGLEDRVTTEDFNECS